MSRRLQLLPLAALAAVVPFVESLLAQPGKKKGTNYAFLVGCAGYNKAELQPIKDDVTVNDVIEFKKALLATGFGEDHIVMMHDKRTDERGRYLPERDKIVKELDLLLDGLTKDDTVVVVVSGHGIHFKGDKFGYFCPIDAKVSAKEKLLPMDGDGGLYPQLEKCKAGRKLLIANACRNDPTAGASLAGGKIELVDDYPETVPKGIAAIYSCDVGQKSYFDPDRKRSLFFLHLTDAWQGKGDGPVSLEEVLSQTKVKTKADANKTFGEKQFPVAKWNYEGEWSIAAAVKERKPGEEVEFEIADKVKMVFCWIPPGECQLGSPLAERQAVKVNQNLKVEPDWLKTEAEGVRGTYATKTGFWLAKYPTTQMEWTAVMGTTPFAFQKDGTSESYVKRVEGLDTGRFPAERVSWDDAQEFLKVVNKRGGVANVFGKAGQFKLPHEDEWEYACRGAKGNKQPYYWGNTATTKEANILYELKRPTAVGSYAKVAPHPWKLCDMIGNVWQLCDNLYDSEQKNIIARGGSWCDYYSSDCRSAYRSRREPVGRSDHLGFRVCVALDK